MKKIIVIYHESFDINYIMKYVKTISSGQSGTVFLVNHSEYGLTVLKRVN